MLIRHRLPNFEAPNDQGTTPPVVPPVATPTPVEPGLGDQGTPTPAVGGTPTPAEPGSTPAATTTPATSVPVVPPSDGVSKRISELTGEKWAERRAREAAEQRAKLAEDTLAELQRIATPTPGIDPATGVPKPATPSQPAINPSDLRRMAQEEALLMDFNKRCNDAVQAGRTAHTDFDASLDGLRKIAGPVLPQALVEAALESGKADEVLYLLGKDPSEADRIMSMPPLQQAAAVTRYAYEKVIRATPSVSNAPKPVGAPVGGSGARVGGPVDLFDDKSSMEDWMAERNRQLAPKRKTA